MIIEPLIDQLKITDLELCECTLYPELDKYKDQSFEILLNYNFSYSREVYEDLKTKEPYEEIEITTNVKLIENLSKEPLAYVSIILILESKLLKLEDVDVNSFILMNEIGITHCAAWLAHRSIGTPLENRIIQHVSPSYYGPDIMDSIKSIWK